MMIGRLALALAALLSAAAAPYAPQAGAGPQGDRARVAWCLGMVEGYLDLRARAMPEVRRIEAMFRRPGADLDNDLAVYADLARESAARRDAYAPLLSAEGAPAATARRWRDEGRRAWTAASERTDAALAHEWMSWTLPAGCDEAAARLAAAPKPEPQAQARPPADSRTEALRQRCGQGVASACQGLARLGLTP